MVSCRYEQLLAAVARGLPNLANIPSPTESQVIDALFSTAAEASIITMQNKIESTCYNLGKQASKRDATAGTQVAQLAQLAAGCLTRRCLDDALTSHTVPRFVRMHIPAASSAFFLL